jgi:hypothetical protein
VTTHAKISEVNIGTLLFIYVIFATLQFSQYVNNDVKAPLQGVGGWLHNLLARKILCMYYM